MQPHRGRSKSCESGPTVFVPHSCERMRSRRIISSYAKKEFLTQVHAATIWRDLMKSLETIPDLG